MSSRSNDMWWGHSIRTIFACRNCFIILSLKILINLPLSLFFFSWISQNSALLVHSRPLGVQTSDSENSVSFQIKTHHIALIQYTVFYSPDILIYFPIFNNRPWCTGRIVQCVFILIKECQTLPLSTYQFDFPTSFKSSPFLHLIYISIKI